MKKILTLEETAKMMLSEDYKERFKAEYYQLVNRYEALKLMLKRWDAGTLDFKPACSRGICQSQIEAMEKYINVLEVRAFAERIDLLSDENELIETIAEAVHNALWEEKKKQGITDHPDMLPYKSLAENIKEYDRVTAKAVMEQLKKKGLLS